MKRRPNLFITMVRTQNAPINGLYDNLLKSNQSKQNQREKGWKVKGFTENGNKNNIGNLTT